MAGANQMPTVVDDPYELNRDTATQLVFSVTELLSNDIDGDGDAIWISEVGQPLHGSVINHGDGTYTYHPKPDFLGEDHLVYSITDGNEDDWVEDLTGLTTWWKLDGNLNDTAPYGTQTDNGTIGGSTTFATDAERGNVLSLDGITNSVSIPDSTDLNSAVYTQRTISVRFKTDDINAKQLLFSTGKYWNGGMSLYLDDGMLYGGVYSKYGTDIFISASVETGTWQRASLTYDGGVAASLYLDGELIETHTCNIADIRTTTDNPAIGKSTGPINYHDSWKDNAANPYAGLLSDIRVYSRPLLASELASQSPNGKVVISVTGTPPPVPESFTHTITNITAATGLTLQLTRVNTRATNYSVRVHVATNENGEVFETFIPGEQRSYLGAVDGYPGASAAACRLSTGKILSMVVFDRGETWWAENGVVYNTRAVGLTDVYADPGENEVVAEGKLGTNTYAYSMGFDLPYDAFSNRYGANLTNAIEYLDYNMAQLQLVQVNNMLMKPEYGAIIIRSVKELDPFDHFTGSSSGTNPDTGTSFVLEFQNHWEDHYPDLLESNWKVCSYSPSIGGGASRTSQRTGTNPDRFYDGRFGIGNMAGDGNFIIVWRHEIGHTFLGGDGMNNGSEGATLMCGNGYHRYGSPMVANYLSFRDWVLSDEITQGRLVDRGVYNAVNLPPYAAMDRFAQFPGAGLHNILGNDQDANNHALELIEFDSTSSLGGSISLSAGSGPGGVDQLNYTSPMVSEETLDYYRYKIRDASGQTATGVALIVLLPPTTFEEWGNFYQLGTNTTIASDTDGDWLGDFAEYAAGSNPRVFEANATRLLQDVSIHSSTNDTYLTVSLDFRLLASDVRYIVESDVDLDFADPQEVIRLEGPYATAYSLIQLANRENVLEVVEDLDMGRVRVRDVEPVSEHAKRFMRLLIEQRID